ncbi:MAG: tetratricopeptide repeat protein [Bacteroidota bacterium]|nr:tetratricopeptide repeat protein [Bacteroidota bacterium]
MLLKAYVRYSIYTLAEHYAEEPVLSYVEHPDTPPILGLSGLTATDPYIRERVLAGIDAFYSMRYDLATSIYDELIAKYPTDPTGYFFRSQIYLWRYLFDYSEPDYKKFIAACDKAISVAEEAIKLNPDNNYARTIIGAIYGFRAIANFRAENFVKATLDGRSCYNYLSEVLKRDPKQYDAYLGMGVFHFGIAVMPSTVRFAANFAGLKGDRELGLKEISIAAEKSLFSRSDAKIFLAFIEVYYNKDYGKGFKYLQELLEQYPNNVPTLYTMGNLQTFLKKMTYANEYYQRVVALADTNFRTFYILANYRMGEAYFRLNEFEKAKVCLQRYFKARFERSFRGIAFYRLALIYEILGNRAEAVKGYQKCIEVAPFEPEDKYAIRKAKERLKTPLDDIEIQLIKGTNAAESSRWTEVEPFLKPLADNISLSKEIRAEACYYMGEACRGQQRFQEAIQYYLKAIELQPERERWFMPWGYFRIAEIYNAQNNREKSRVYLDKAKAFSDYDFQEPLAFLIERDITLLKY